MKFERLKDIFVFITLIGIAYMFFFKIPNSKKKALSGNTATGTIYEIDRATRNIYFEFNDILGNSYHSSLKLPSSYINSIIVGQCFEVKYQPDNPSNSEIIMDKPLILLPHGFTTGQTSDPNLVASKQDLVSFTYRVKGEEFQRMQRIGERELTTVINKTYFVKYQLDNPSIAILLLDSIYSNFSVNPLEKQMNK